MIGSRCGRVIRVCGGVSGLFVMLSVFSPLPFFFVH